MKRTATLYLATSLALAAAACKKEDAGSGPSQPDEQATTATSEPTRSSPPEAAPSVDAVLAGYEQARALLAADKLEGVAHAARDIETTARAAASGASDANRTHLTSIAGAAGRMAKAEDLAAARASFGEVSRPLVQLLAANPDLAKGRHVFECPMAKGYSKWVQPTAKLENPYMGQEMLTCGGESRWE
jgi:hypothetical protein